MISPIHLSNTDLGAVVLTVGTVVYSVFHRYEPHRPEALAGLLLFIPAILSGLAMFCASGLIAAMITPVAYWSLLALLTLIYRLSSFHPLAKYPGPFLHRISKLRIVHTYSQGGLHKHFQKLHQQYGDVVRVGPNELSYCNTDGVQGTLGNSGLPKGRFYVAGAVGSMLWEMDRNKHLQLRKPWNKAFSGDALHEYEPVVIRRTQELIGELEKRVSGSVDISRWMDYFSFDVMGDIVFGFPFDMMKEGADVHNYWKAVNSSMSRAGFMAQIPWSTFYIRRFQVKFGKDQTTIAPLARKMVGQRLKAGSVTKDLFYHLSSENGIEKGNIDLLHLTREGATAIVAGSDTTSTVMSSLWYYFLRNPSYYVRLQKEVDLMFSTDEEPFDQGKLSRMPYLNACLNEAMRLQPPVPSGSQRAVLNGTGGKIIGDNFIPEGNTVFVPTYALHRDPRYFYPYPEDFWPDRWLPSEERMDKNDTSKPFTAHNEVVLEHKAFIPFSAGPRVCVGKPLAWTEMRMVVSSIVQKFGMTVADGFHLDDWEQSLEDHYVLKKGSLPIRLTHRI